MQNSKKDQNSEDTFFFVFLICVESNLGLIWLAEISSLDASVGKVTGLGL